MDISRVLLGLAFVGLIFILLNSYCGCNLLEGMEEDISRCDKNIGGSRCPGIDGKFCKDLKNCQNEGACPCPTKEEICNENCPKQSCPSCPSSSAPTPIPPSDNRRSIYLIKNGLDTENGLQFKEIILDKYKKVRQLKNPLRTAELINNPSGKFDANEFEKYFFTLDPPMEIIITPEEDPSKTYTYNYRLAGFDGSIIYFYKEIIFSPDDFKYIITNQDLLETNKSLGLRSVNTMAVNNNSAEQSYITMDFPVGGLISPYKFYLSISTQVDDNVTLQSSWKVETGIMKKINSLEVKY